jgi:hypothetical protein
MLRLPNEPRVDARAASARAAGAGGPSLCDWATLTAEELRRRGLDPNLRPNNTGHRYPLSPVWSKTVGAWCVEDTDGFLAPNTGLICGVDRRNFETFKYRHRLRTGPQFRRAEGTRADDPWYLSQLVYDTYNEKHVAAQRRAPLNHVTLAVEVGKSVGVLPIEAVLYIIQFDEFLTHNGLNRTTWGGLEYENQKYLWEKGRLTAGGETRAWDILEIYHRSYVNARY